jgi:membrane protein
VNLKSLKSLLVKSGVQWSDDSAPRLAAAFSFYAILSLAPVLIVAVFGAGLFYGQRVDALNELLGQAKSAIGAQGTKLLQEMVYEAMNRRTGIIATVFSLAVTFFSASNLFLAFDDSVNAIWKIRSAGPPWKIFLVSRLLAFVMVLVFGVIVIAWLGFDAWLTWMEAHVPGIIQWQYVSVIATLFLLVLIAAVALKSLPRKRLKWSDVWPGAIITAIGVDLAKFLLGAYFSSFHVSKAYGPAGAVVLVLLWIYYVAQIYFFGVEVTYVYAHEYGSRKGLDEPRLNPS